MCRGCHPHGSPIAVSGLAKPGRAAAFRKRSMANRTVSSIESEIEIFLSKCPFLASSEDEPSCVAKFHRSEIEVGELLGKGAFSEVYQVKAVNPCFEHEDEEENLRCVIHEACKTQDNDADQFIVKHLRPELLTQRTAFNNAAADLVLESKFLAALDHPNIIKIHGWAANGAKSFGDGSHDGFFVMLEQLDDILSRRISLWRKDPSSAPPMEQRLGYATQIAGALQYLHSKNIIFRDLKCDNIGFKDGAIRLFDLGLCRELPENSSRDDMFLMSGVGTPRYVAPEIVLGTGYNLGADVYSFSIVCYELLAIAKPFDLYNIGMYRMLVCEDGERPQLVASWPQELQTLLTSMWDAESSVRPTMDEIHSQLSEIHSKATPGALTSLLSSLKFPKRLVRMATGSFSEGTSTTVTSAASLNK
mmetsp:Transcript_350/g.510  ORF Transcript_350/g.510 Transcript_350/m.510 type:complete len:418 (+) Transcript_350:114-1367(+)|eukprot:CAMPEP_0113629266 /NCGR_PEP_ID=MMETSP0017_2-20120614/15187_1 /TAXON_ID=2856 /ORGANISM="Cylindrotheca closterium" /LENGTH=417 /DNA_ID=CAMNT_0000539647 /DNA_START=61 /DNA_END=1314 /DNA_ORIENTATION=+ /assembly_acc=CAM_ASM_000147